MFDGAQWLPFGATALDITFSHSGSQSVHVHLAALPAATQGGSGIDVNRSFVTGPATVWIRAWVRLASLPASTNAMELISFVQTGAPNLGDEVFLRAADTQLYHQWNADSGSAGVAPPLNTWFCLVWKVVRATNTTGGSFLTSDVVPAVSLPNTVTDGTPAMDTLSLGAFFSATNVDVDQPAIDLWIDDVIISDTAVGCAD